MDFQLRLILVFVFSTFVDFSPSRNIRLVFVLLNSDYFDPYVIPISIPFKEIQIRTIHVFNSGISLEPKFVSVIHPPSPWKETSGFQYLLC